MNFTPASHESFISVPEFKKEKNVMFFSSVVRGRQGQILNKGGKYLFTIEGVSDDHLLYFVNQDSLNKVIGKWSEERMPTIPKGDEVLLFSNVLKIQGISKLDFNSDIGLLIRIVYAEMSPHKDKDEFRNEFVSINEIDRRIVIETIYNRMADSQRVERYQSYTVERTIRKTNAYQGVGNIAKFDNTINHFWENLSKTPKSEADLYKESFHNIIQLAYQYVNNTIGDFINTEVTFYVTDRDPEYFTNKKGFQNIEIEGISTISACAIETV